MTAKQSMLVRTHIAPRRYCPHDFRKARVGTIDQSASALAYLIRRRMQNARGTEGTATVLVDLDGSVYACLRNGPTLASVLAMAPHILVGVYTVSGAVGDLAADIECHRRVMS